MEYKMEQTCLTKWNSHGYTKMEQKWVTNGTDMEIQHGHKQTYNMEQTIEMQNGSEIPYTTNMEYKSNRHEIQNGTYMEYKVKQTWNTNWNRHENTKWNRHGIRNGTVIEYNMEHMGYKMEQQSDTHGTELEFTLDQKLHTN